MKKTKFKFYVFKVMILLLINLIIFAVSVLLSQILSTLKIPDFTDSQNLTLIRIIVSFITNVAFVIYIIKVVMNIKSTNVSVKTFVSKEIIAYTIFLLPLIVTILIVGMPNINTNPICLFYTPNMFFYYLTQNFILGLILTLMCYTICITIAYMLLIRKKLKSTKI